MNAAPPSLPPNLEPAPAQARVLRRLFLTLFLRGRSARGLQKGTAPKSLARKLALTLFFYALFGSFAFYFLRESIFVLSVYLHAMTFAFLGMFVAASAGEVLFNKEEPDILLHRPVSAQALLWAKIGVMVQVSLWLAGAFNGAGYFVGVICPNGSWLYPLAHILSMGLEALFCTGCIVLGYQLCLRWFGRERLDSLMTTTQTLVAVAVIAGGQLLPRLMMRYPESLHHGLESWWIRFLPPAWFAGLDDAIAGQHTSGAWMLGGTGVLATALVLWISFVKLARNYQSGLQSMNESAPRAAKKSGRRWLEFIVNAPPLRWWLRDPVSRGAFLLVAAYLARDRETKLRIYPGLAPVLVMPAIFLLQNQGRQGGDGGFGIAFACGYLGLVPMLGLNLLRYSQQWQAADLFRYAPIAGPAQLCHGARRAVICFLMLPLLVGFGMIIWLLNSDRSQLALILPGLIALPVYSLVPCFGGRAVPFSNPAEEARSARRGLSVIAVMFAVMALSGVAIWALHTGWFRWFLLGEATIVAGLHLAMQRAIAASRWEPID